MIESLPHASLSAAFFAGLLSFVSPCVLPLVPSYLMYITGLSLDQLSDSAERQRLQKTIIVNSLIFIAGFSAVFIAFGASASLIGQILTDSQDFIRKVGAGLIVLFGLYLTGLVKLKFLMIEKRLHLRSRPAGYLGSFLIGAAFAAGWTPCVGPVLGTVLLYASMNNTLTDGVSLLAFYSLGLGAPLFLSAIGLDRFFACFRQVRAYLGVVSVVSGIFLILFGVLMYRDALPLLIAFFERYGIGAYVETPGGGA
ncbi:MAG: cytochrome c biogenesis CcdA family protein [Nitrospiraceae bacterium]